MPYTIKTTAGGKIVDEFIPLRLAKDETFAIGDVTITATTGVTIDTVTRPPRKNTQAIMLDRVVWPIGTGVIFSLTATQAGTVTITYTGSLGTSQALEVAVVLNADPDDGGQLGPALANPIGEVFEHVINLIGCEVTPRYFGAEPIDYSSPWAFDASLPDVNTLALLAMNDKTAGDSRVEVKLDGLYPIRDQLTLPRRTASVWDCGGLSDCRALSDHQIGEAYLGGQIRGLMRVGGTGDAVLGDKGVGFTTKGVLNLIGISSGSMTRDQLVAYLQEPTNQGNLPKYGLLAYGNPAAGLGQGKYNAAVSVWGTQWAVRFGYGVFFIPATDNVAAAGVLPYDDFPVPLVQQSKITGGTTTFPADANQGDVYGFSGSCTIDGMTFGPGTYIAALVPSPSTTTYWANWTVLTTNGEIGGPVAIWDNGDNSNLSIYSWKCFGSLWIAGANSLSFNVPFFYPSEAHEHIRLGDPGDTLFLGGGGDLHIQSGGVLQGMQWPSNKVAPTVVKVYSTRRDVARIHYGLAKVDTMKESVGTVDWVMLDMADCISADGAPLDMSVRLHNANMKGAGVNTLKGNACLRYIDPGILCAEPQFKLIETPLGGRPRVFIDGGRMVELDGGGNPVSGGNPRQMIAPGGVDVGYIEHDNVHTHAGLTIRKAIAKSLDGVCVGDLDCDRMLYSQAAIAKTVTGTTLGSMLYALGTTDPVAAVGSLTCEADMLAVGGVLYIDECGIFTSGASGAFQWKPALIGDVEHLLATHALGELPLTVEASKSNYAWRAHLECTVVAVGASGQLKVDGFVEWQTASGQPGRTYTASGSVRSIDTTVPLTLALTGRWTAAGNSAQAHQTSFRYVGPED